MTASSLVTYAQNRVHMGIGYNHSYARLDSLNYILNAFNAENPWTASRKMSEIHMPVGVTAHVGCDLDGVLLEFQFTMRIAQSRAVGELSPNSIETQEAIVRYNASTADLGIGVFLLRRESFRIALGQSLDFGNVLIEGKRGPSTLIRGQIFGRYVNELNFGTTSFLHFMIAFRDGVGPGIFIRPYFQACLRQNDYQPLNSAFRPVESLKDSQFILGSQSNIGLKLGVFLGS
ncbi:MAG: hypothetical protein RLZZ165_445 [Bacteroidota bacterium]|jgi:hypothetical protein